MDKKEILIELGKKFEEIKKEIDFTPSFEELEKEFSITDMVLSNGFVSENFSKQIYSRIAEFYRDWHGYLNNLLLPNPSYYAGQTEAKIFNSEEDKKKIWKLVETCMKFSSMHSLVGLSSNKEKEKEFINETYFDWINHFKPGIIYLMSKVYEEWKK